MPRGKTAVAYRHVRTLFEAGALGALTDGQLLELFTTRRDDEGRRACLRGAGRSPRADGPGRLPPHPPRLTRLGRCLPGDVPRPGSPGGRRAGGGFAGPLALRGEPARRPPGQGVHRPAVVARSPGGGTCGNRGPRSRLPARAGSGPGGAARGPRRGGRPAAGEVPRGRGAVRPGGDEARRGGAAARLPRRDGREPALAGPRATPDPPGPPRAGAGGPGHGRDRLAGPGVGGRPPRAGGIDGPPCVAIRGRAGAGGRRGRGVRDNLDRKDYEGDVHEPDEDGRARAPGGGGPSRSGSSPWPRPRPGRPGETRPIPREGVHFPGRASRSRSSSP